MADDPKKYPNRFKCAQYTAFCVVFNYQANSKGEVMDFSAEGYSYWKGFYMKNILKYALEANDGD